MDTKSQRSKGEITGRSMEERIIATAQLGIKFIEAWLNPMI
jgi:hypothetical protein